MKKLLASCSTAVLLVAASGALAGGPEIVPVVEDYFSGFYVGGTLAAHSMTSDQSASFVANDPILLASQKVPFGTGGNSANVILSIPTGMTSNINTNDGGAINPYGGVQGGFNWTFNHRWVAGIAGFGEWGAGTASASSNVTLTPVVTGTITDSSGAVLADVSGFNVTSSSSNLNTNVTTEITNDYGVKGKLGWLVTPTTLLYGVIGASWATIQVTGSVNGYANASATSAAGMVPIPVVISGDMTLVGSSSNTETKVGLLGGAGIEQFVYQDLISVNLEYNYVNYGTVSTGPVDVSVASSETVSPAGSATPGNQNITQTLTNAFSASGNATVNTVLAGVNIYFGRNWL